MKLSVLDQAPVTKGNTAADALLKAAELAVLAEELGYERIWMAEHHGAKNYASSAPEITAAYLAAKTNKIRIGTGGTMMMHYSPLKMAEVFKSLSAFAPGRIDFGVGRAPGGDHASIFALSQGNRPNLDNMYEKLDVALQLLKDEVPNDELYNKTPAVPEQIVLPESWLLGSSGNSALQAARKGLGYSYAQFFTGEMDKAVLEQYRRNFEPSAFMNQATINVAYMVTAAETTEEAEFEALPQDLIRLWMSQGKMGPILTPEEAQDFPLNELDRMRLEQGRKQHIVGSAKEVAEELTRQQEHYGFDEAMIVSIPHSQEQRLNTYRLLAKELL